MLNPGGVPAAAGGERGRVRQLVGAANGTAGSTTATAPRAAPKRPLEPHFLKRADGFITEHLHEQFMVDELATHCGVGVRTLQQAFLRFRGLTPIAHTRNMRLDGAHRALTEESATVADVAARYAFRSPTTFAAEYRKRYGAAPSQAARVVRTKDG